MKIELTRELLKDIVEWDTVNWGKVIRRWNDLGFDFEGKKVLDIGGRNGGLSLFFALQGACVVCSDYGGVPEAARELHRRYGVSDRVTYADIDATAIGREFEFDFICFKSVLGGIGSGGNRQRQVQAISEMMRALKPTGTLLFCENLRASRLHRLARRLFVRWGKTWYYQSLKEIRELVSAYRVCDCKTVGFLGAFGRREGMRRFLGHMDTLFDKVAFPSSRYICSMVLKKD